MSRDILVKEYENDTGNKFNVECIVYNDYAEWLEHTVISERKIPIEANSTTDTKQLIIGDVSKQRELLIAFHKSLNIYTDEAKQGLAELDADTFLSNL